ncbi:zinc ribbon domain-containing protein [Propionicimonas sp.]|uniref:zinc ribbon domain-containing protein n=1 Tax=Propionicimonas sp. TaxID=1955623 RepID=UPI0039E4491D
MLADPAAQLRLLDLQAEDTAIAQLEHRRRSLPEHTALAEARVVRSRLGESLVAARTTVGDLQLDVEKAEADLVPVRERQARDQQRVDAGTVTDPKQLNALLEEIAHLGRRISDLEDVELEVMEQLEAATADQDRIAAELSELETSMRGLIASRDEQVARIDAEQAAHQAAHDTIAADIPADLLALYDRIRPRSGGVGAAALTGRRCGGCQLEATQSALVGYAAAAPNEVLRCEECERILVRTSAVVA